MTYKILRTSGRGGDSTFHTLGSPGPYSWVFAGMLRGTAPAARPPEGLDPKPGDRVRDQGVEAALAGLGSSVKNTSSSNLPCSIARKPASRARRAKVPAW